MNIQGQIGYLSLFLKVNFYHCSPFSEQMSVSARRLGGVTPVRRRQSGELANL